MAISSRSVESMYRAAGKSKIATETSITDKSPGYGKTLVYPFEMDQQSFYPESIKFTVYKRQSASLAKVAKVTKEEMKKFGQAIKKVLPSATAKWDDYSSHSTIKSANEFQDLQAANKAAQNGSITGEQTRTVINYLKNAEILGTDMWSSITTIAKSLTEGLNQKNIEQSTILDFIYLNMPNEITFAEPVAWEGTELGLVGSLAKADASSPATGALSNFGNIIGGGTGALAGMLSSKVGPAIGGILGTLGGTGAQKAIESSFANIANPYKEMTFSGIGFREFSFNFVFRARNINEVDVVQDIINAFRRYSKPTYNADWGSSFLNYPEEFHIEFLTKQENEDKFITNPYIPQIKLCVCKNITTNFTSQNTWRSLNNGHPVEISLALTFEETELITAEDVIGNTQIGRFKTIKGNF